MGRKPEQKIGGDKQWHKWRPRRPRGLRGPPNGTLYKNVINEYNPSVRNFNVASLDCSDMFRLLQSDHHQAVYQTYKKISSRTYMSNNFHLTFLVNSLMILTKKNQLDALISQIYFGNKTLHVSTVPLSIIRSFSLYTQQWYMCWQLASKLSANLYDVYIAVCIVAFRNLRSA